MTDEQRSRAIKVIAESLAIEESHVTPEKQFFADFGSDSLDEVEIVMALEYEFAILIADEDAEKCITVADALALVDHLLSVNT